MADNYLEKAMERHNAAPAKDSTRRVAVKKILFMGEPIEPFLDALQKTGHKLVVFSPRPLMPGFRPTPNTTILTEEQMQSGQVPGGSEVDMCIFNMVQVNTAEFGSVRNDDIILKLNSEPDDGCTAVQYETVDALVRFVKTALLNGNIYRKGQTIWLR